MHVGGQDGLRVRTEDTAGQGMAMTELLDNVTLYGERQHRRLRVRGKETAVNRNERESGLVYWNRMEDS